MHRKRNRNNKNIAVNKGMFIVHRKHLNKVLDMLQVANKEAQSLLLAFSVSAAEFEYLFAGQGILRLEQQ